MKIVETIILIVMTVFIGHLKITLHPFAISMEYWWRALGFVLIGLGITLLTSGEYSRGRIKGQNEAFDACIKELKKRQEDVI